MSDQQIRNVQWTITVPMSFPIDSDKDLIEFHLNESSWCCSNLIDILSQYDQKHGCICPICSDAKVIE